MITIYSHEITSRLTYTLDFVFKERDIPYSIVTSVEEFEVATTPKLDYTNEGTFEQHSLLFEDGIRAIQIEKGEFNGEDCLKLDGKIDPLAAIFYHLSRYEEYGEVGRDEHGRFAFEQSFLCQFDWIEKAMSDRWAIAILNFAHIWAVGQYFCSKSEHLA